MGWARHVACMEERRSAYSLVEKPDGMRALGEKPDVDGKIIQNG